MAPRQQNEKKQYGIHKGKPQQYSHTIAALAEKVGALWMTRRCVYENQSRQPLVEVHGEVHDGPQLRCGNRKQDVVDIIGKP